MPATSRNPKVSRFTISLDATMNARLEALADKLGINKATAATTFLAVGVNVFEPILSIGVEKYADQALADKKQQLVQDMGLVQNSEG